MIAGIRDWVKLDRRNYGWFAWSNPDVMESGFQTFILIALLFSVMTAWGAPPPPPEVTGVTASQGTGLYRVHITWSAANDATSYDLIIGSTKYATDIQGLSYVYDSPTADHKLFSVVAKNAAGKGPQSDKAEGWAKLLDAAKNVTATQGSVLNTAQLDWNAVPDATGYEVYRADDGFNCENGILELVGKTTATRFTDTTLGTGNVYWYSIKPISEQPYGTYTGPYGIYCTTAWNDPLSSTAWISPSFVSQVAGVSASQGTLYGKVNISWNASPLATSYDVYRASDNINPSSIIASGLTNLSYIDTSVSGTTNYYYSVVANNANSVAPKSVSAAGWAKLPASVDMLTATHGAVLNTAQLNWNANADATGYKVYRADVSGGALTYLGTTTNTAYTDTNTGTVPDYYYKVSALADTTEGPLGNEAVWFAPPLPDQATGVSASQGIAYGKVTLNWSASKLATGYDIYRSKNSTLGSLIASNVTDLDYVDGVSGSSSYYYTVVARNTSGFASNSQNVLGWGKSIDAVNTLTATQGTVLNAVQLSWSAVTDATSYTIYRLIAPWDGALLNRIAKHTVVTDTTYLDSITNIDRYYYYKVVPNVGNVAGAISREALGWAKRLPDAVLGVYASQGAYLGSVTITWATSTLATAYDLYRSTSAGSKGSIVATSISGTSYDDSTVSGNTRYYYTVVATNAYGNAPDSAQAVGYSKVLSTITSLTATQGTVTGLVVLNWSPETESAEYEIWRSTSSGGIPELIQSTAYTTFFDTSVNGVANYFYTVRAKSGTDIGPFSSEATGYANAAPTAATVLIESTSHAESTQTSPLITDPNSEAGQNENFTLKITEQPLAGIVSVTDGKFMYSPAPDGNFSGSQSFKFSVTDIAGETLLSNGTVNVSCEAPSIRSLSALSGLLPFVNQEYKLVYDAPSCNNVLSGSLTITSLDNNSIVDVLTLPLNQTGGNINLSAIGQGFPEGNYQASIEIAGTGGNATKNITFSVKSVPLPEITISTTVIDQGETPIIIGIRPSTNTDCSLTGNQSDAENNPNLCFVRFEGTLPELQAGFDSNGLPKLTGYPYTVGFYTVKALVSRWVNDVRYDAAPLTKTFTVKALPSPIFSFMGKSTVYVDIEKVGLVFKQASGTVCQLYSDETTAKNEAANGKRACFATFSGVTGLISSLSINQIKFEGLLTTIGAENLSYSVKRAFPDGTIAEVAAGDFTISVIEKRPPIVILKGGYKVLDGSYYVQEGQAITRAKIIAGVPTDAKMHIVINDGENVIERNKITDNSAYWILSPTLAYMEQRNVTLRVSWQDYPAFYTEEVMTVVGGTESNMKLVLEAPQKVADTENISIKIKVGKYTRSGITYTPETMGQWRTQVFAETNHSNRKFPITDMQDMVNGEASFQINPAGNLYMKLTAVSELVTNIDGLVSVLTSSTRFIEVAKGTPIEGVISAKTLDGPAPKTFTLNLDMTKENRVALKEISWEESSDNGSTWTPIEKTNAMRHNVTMRDPGKQQVRARMVNKNTLVESYTAPVEVWAYAKLEAVITGPRHVAPGYTATLSSELFRSGVLTADTVNEWTIVAPSGTTVTSGATATISEALEGKILVTLKSRPTDTRADDPSAWSAALYYLLVKIPASPSISATGPRDVELGKTYHYQGTIRPSWGTASSVNTIQSEWQLPDGSTVAGASLDWAPGAQELIDKKPLIFRAWVDGFKDTTTKETTVTYAPWQYVWPNFTMSMKQLTVQAPSDLLLMVNHDQPAMSRRFEGLTYTWSFPSNVTGRQNDAFPNRAAAQVLYAGEYDVSVTIQDTRGHETVLTQHIVAEAAIPYTVTLKVGKSNIFDRVPMTVTVRPTIYGGHPLDSVISQAWKIDGIPIDDFANRSYMVSNITETGSHVISYTLSSKMGETTTVESPINLISNQLPVCELKAIPNAYVVYAEAKCSDPDGKVIAYAWKVDGEPIGSTSYRISFNKSTTPQSASVTITAMDDAKEYSVPVSIKVNY